MSPRQPSAVRVPPAVERERVVRVIRPIRFGALPELPVEAGRHRWPGRVVLLPALRPERAIRPVVHFADVADRAGVDPRGQRVAIRRVAVGEQVRDRRLLAGHVQRPPQFGRPMCATGLCAITALPFLSAEMLMLRVLVIGRDVHDALDVRLLLEHLAVVLVRPDARARALLLPVVDLHDLFRDLAAGADAVARAPRRLLEERAGSCPGCRSGSSRRSSSCRDSDRPPRRTAGRDGGPCRC